MIEVPRVRAPRPPPHIHAGRRAYIPEFSIPHTPVQRIPPRMLPVKCPNLLRLALVEFLLLRYAQPRCRPHIRNIDVLLPIAIKIRPASTHPRPGILNP